MDQVPKLSSRNFFPWLLRQEETTGTGIRWDRAQESLDRFFQSTVRSQTSEMGDVLLSVLEGKTCILAENERWTLVSLLL